MSDCYCKIWSKGRPTPVDVYPVQCIAIEREADYLPLIELRVERAS